MHDVQEFPVLGKFDMARGGILIAPQNIHQFQPSCHVIEQINIDMVHAEIRRTEEFIVSCHLHAAHMGP